MDARELEMQGIGSVDSVCATASEWLSSVGVDTNVCESLRNVWKTFGDGDDSRIALLAMICAILNTQYTKTGTMYFVKANGVVDHTYMSPGASRDILGTCLG
jgi:hypothetical protein